MLIAMAHGWGSTERIEQGPARLTRRPWASCVLDVGLPTRSLPKTSPEHWATTTTLRREPGPSGWSALFCASAPEPHGSRDEITLLTDPRGARVAVILRGVVSMDRAHPGNAMVGLLRPRGRFTDDALPQHVWPNLQALHTALCDAAAWLDHPAWQSTDPAPDQETLDAQARTLLTWAPHGHTVEQARGWEAVGVDSAEALREWRTAFTDAAVAAWAPRFRDARTARPWAESFADPSAAQSWYRRTSLAPQTAGFLHALGWAVDDGSALTLALSPRREFQVDRSQIGPLARVVAHHGQPPEAVLALLKAGVSADEAEMVLAEQSVTLDGLRALAALRT